LAIVRDALARVHQLDQDALRAGYPGDIRSIEIL
jgi:hypothetical protein